MQAVIFANGDIISNNEPIRAEMIAGLVGLATADSVAKGPGSAGLAHQMADFICLIWAKPDDPAKVRILMPEMRIDPAIGIQGGDKPVANQSTPFGMAFLARELQTNAPEGGRELGPIALWSECFMRSSWRFLFLWEVPNLRRWFPWQEPYSAITRRFVLRNLCNLSWHRS